VTEPLSAWVGGTVSGRAAWFDALSERENSRSGWQVATVQRCSKGADSARR